MQYSSYSDPEVSKLNSFISLIFNPPFTPPKIESNIDNRNVQYGNFIEFNDCFKLSILKYNNDEESTSNITECKRNIELNYVDSKSSSQVASSSKTPSKLNLSSNYGHNVDSKSSSQVASSSKTTSKL
ncbi:unnamed protein product, partial [Brachionus calyciflorus]